MNKIDNLKQQLSELEYEIYSLRYILDMKNGVAPEIVNEVNIKINSLLEESKKIKKELKKISI